MKKAIFIILYIFITCSYKLTDNSNSIDPFQFLSRYKDSSEFLLKKGICPDYLYDPCLDYRREFYKYHTCVWNLKTQKQEFCLCTDRVYCSFKEDLIDSIDINYLRFIYLNLDTMKLNKKCIDSLHNNSEPEICRKYSTLDLIKRRLINDTI